jgi:hypothetical protein
VTRAIFQNKPALRFISAARRGIVERLARISAAELERTALEGSRS